MAEYYDGNTDSTAYSGEERYDSKPAVSIEGWKFTGMVYLFMALGFVISFGVAMLVGKFLQANPGILVDGFTWVIAVIVLQVAVALIISLAFKKLPHPAVIALYFVYTALQGFCLSTVFAFYERYDFYMAFAATAVAFGTMTAFGFLTKRDYGKLGWVLLACLIGLIPASLIGFFFGGVVGLIACTVCTGIFMIITVIDTKKVRQYAETAPKGGESVKVAVVCAMQLFLDFINILLYILRILSYLKRK